MSFFVELKRRNVFKVGIAYIIVAWLVLQVSDTLVPALHLPEWFHSGVAFVLIIGFPIAMIFAWAFEMTPEGLKKEREVDRTQSITNVTGQKLNSAMIGVLVLALGYAGTALSFDGSGSTDPDGTIASYAWDFGDGGTGSGPAPSHTYATAGLYTVSLTVTDNVGASSSPATTTASIGTIADVIPPVISLLGSNPVNVELGSTYSDAGATASDNIDGDLTANIISISTVNTDLAGIYSVTYNVSDAAGNPATEVSRIVNVTADIMFGDGFEGNP